MATPMIVCPLCGEMNSAQKQKCFSCGHPFPGVAAEAPAATASRVEESVPRVNLPAMRNPTLRQRAQFYRMLHAQLHAGIPLGVCLDCLAENDTLLLRRLVRVMAKRVMGGERLSVAMADYPRIFPEWEIGVMTAAERGGTLPESVHDIAQTLEMEWQLRSDTRARTWGLRATLVLFVFVLLLVIAARTSVAAKNVIATPLQFIATFFPVVQQFFIILGIAAALTLIWGMWLRTRAGYLRGRALLRGLPFIGPIMRNLVRYRFVQVLGTLWRAGVSPMEALATAAHAADDERLRRIITAQLARVGGGMPLSEAIGASGNITPAMLYLIRTGEASGNVPEMLAKVGEYVLAELQEQLRTLPVRAEFALLLVLGPPVGYLVATTWEWFYNMLIDSI